MNPCTHCKGTGEEPLPIHLQVTLGHFEESQECEAADFHAWRDDRISVNAWSNRLRKLYESGHLTRRRVGKKWMYRKK